MTNLALGSPAAANPFSTRCIRPGSLPFIFADDEDAPQVVARFVALGCRAQIVGPHGVGKSTLLAALAPALAAAGRPAYLVALHDGQRRLPGNLSRNAQEKGATIVIIDGYEQLSRWSRWRLRLACRRRNWGLLVTAHHDVGLPTLVELAPSLAAFQRVVDRLLQHHAHGLPSELVAERFAACGANMREALLALYDDYEGLRTGRAAVASQVSDCAGRDDRAAEECSASSDGVSAPACG